MIPTKAGGGSTTFKFQSDSINTKAKHLLTGLLYCFKFQSDSINTRLGRISEQQHQL